MMFSRFVSARKTMILAVALVAVGSIAVAAGGSADVCVFQKTTSIGQPHEPHEPHALDDMFGEVLTTESNENIYVISICRPVPQMFYDPKRSSGAIKLMPDGKTINLGHINQSNVIIKENGIMLTYTSSERNRDAGDTCKGLRWKTYLTFLCDPLAIHDILTFVDEDLDHLEICQVWFEVTTSKTCKHQSHLPLGIMGKDLSDLKNQNDHEKYSVRMPTNFNEIPSRKNEFDYETSNFNKNRISSNIENKEKPIINDLHNKFNRSFSNEYFSTSDENKITNEEIKNGNSVKIISKDQEKQLENEKEDNYFNKYRKSLYEQNEKEEARIGNSKTNTPEDKTSADNIMKSKLWIQKNMSQYENKEHYPSDDFENKFTYLKINNTVPDTLSNKEYTYLGKNETIANYNNLKKYLDQNKNSEGKYENSVIIESDKYNEYRDGKLNQDIPKDASNNDMKYNKFKDNENMENTSGRNTFENKTSNEEENDSGDTKKPSNNDSHINNKNPNSDNGIKYNTTDGGKIVDISYQNQSIVYDNKVPGDVVKENKANQTHSQNNNPDSKSFQKDDKKNEIDNNPKNVNGSITETTPRVDSSAENNLTGSGNKSVDVNSINTKIQNKNNDNSTIDANEKNEMKNNHSSTTASDDNIIAVTAEPTTTSPTNTMVNDYTNESGKPNGSSIESPVNGSLNNTKINNKSEPNGTIINEVNNVHKNIQPDQNTTPKSSANSSNSDENDDIKTTKDNTNQSGNGFSFDTSISDNFPNDKQLSATTITIFVLVLLVFVTGVVGTAINRYYYKLSGTDQIPFKGTFQFIFNWVKVTMISFCCCCRRSGYDDLEAPDLSNEKTPLLQPTFSVPTPQVIDETSKKSSDSGDNDDSSTQNSNNEYGSISNEKKSLTSEKKYRKIRRKSKISDKNDSTTENEPLVKNVDEKLINADNKVQAKSIKNMISGKINSIFTEKIKPNINNIVEEVEKKVESSDEIKKDLDIISKDAALISKLLENENSTKRTDDVQSNEEIKSENNSEKAQANLVETQNAVVEEEIKSTTLDEPQQSPNVKPLSEVTVSQISVPDLQQIERNEQVSDLKTSTPDRVTAEELTESTKNKNDIVMKNNIEEPQDTVVTSPADAETKTNELKSKFLGLEKEDVNVKKATIDKSDKKVDNEEDDVEVIEEIIYVDASDGAEDEEIIEEIIQTTTVEDSPDESSPGSGHPKVTVHTTRKISSSSLPGEVKTFEETVVTDGTPINEKKQPNFQVDVGKSGISMSVGDKKMEIGKSGLKLNRGKSKSPKNGEGDESNNRDKKSPEKSKKSISMPKIFKRSISQPTGDDIQETEDESASAKKLSKTGSGLMKLRKSPSKSSVVLKTGDITMDKDAMSNFMDNERNASRINVGQGELNLTVGNGDAAASVTISEGKDTPVSMETTEKSIGLGIGVGRDQKSTENAETKSNAKTKKPKKDKTKLTTITRPF